MEQFSNTTAISYPVYDQAALGVSMDAGRAFTGNIGSAYRGR